MSTLRDKLVKTLCDDLSEKELDMLIKTIKQKANKGAKYEDIVVDLMSAIAGAAVTIEPNIPVQDLFDICEEVANRLIDRMLDYYGVPLDQFNNEDEVPPREYLN